MRSVNFPVIEALDVDGYLLYPGSNQAPGLSHSFPPGVNVVVGINGIGKTTLLTILLRMLTGAKDLRVQEELGGSQRVLGGIDTSVFSRRVPDRGTDATATLRFRLGTASFEIRRKLANLQMLEMSLDGLANQRPDIVDVEDRYKYCVTDAARVDDFYDFVLLLRYLVFYLEDRRSLVWDKWAQTEILRILFVADELQATYKTAINTALSADSTARNTQTILTRQENALAKALRIAQENAPSDLGLLRIKVNERTQLVDSLTEELTALDERRRELRRAAEQRRHDAERLSQEERLERERYLASFFPGLTDYGAFVLASIQSKKGCLVCGTTDDFHLEAISKRLSTALTCPLCDAEPSLHEAHATPVSGQDHGTKLAELHAQRTDQLAFAADAERNAGEVNDLFLKTQLQKDQLDTELRADRKQLEFREAAAAGARPEDLSKLDERVRVLKDTVSEALQEKNDSLRTLKEIIDSLTGDLEDFRARLVLQFGVFIASFLAERCELDYRSVPRRIGQGGGLAIEFPEFHVLMTSGVFRQSGTAREEPTSVSESQKEFVELAFRMALLAVAAEDRECSMILETPESSLDAVFMPKAGTTLQEFSAKTQPKRTIVATSNLNGSLMIPALLGMVNAHGEREAHLPDAQAVAPFVLNLLDVAAKSQALLEYEADYRKSLADALQPDTLPR
jgi:hypothetical protein